MKKTHIEICFHGKESIVKTLVPGWMLAETEELVLHRQTDSLGINTRPREYVISHKPTGLSISKAIWKKADGEILLRALAATGIDWKSLRADDHGALAKAFPLVQKARQSIL